MLPLDPAIPSPVNGRRLLDACGYLLYVGAVEVRAILYRLLDADRASEITTQLNISKVEGMPQASTI